LPVKCRLMIHPVRYVKNFLNVLVVLFVRIALESDSIEVIEEQVVTKIFKVRLGKQIITLDDGQAFVLYQQLKQKFHNGAQIPKSKFNEIINKSKEFGYTSYNGSLIPPNYKWFASKKSQPRIGKTPHQYHYFKNIKNEYGFLIKNGITKPFVKLGNIANSESPIGKILGISPKDKPFMKSFYVKSHVTINNQAIKAIVDILEFEGFLKIVGNKNAKILSYRVTNKGLEFENSIEPLKVQNSPTLYR